MNRSTLMDALYQQALDDVDELIEIANEFGLPSDERYVRVAHRWVEKQDENLAEILDRALSMNLTQTSKRLLPEHEAITHNGHH